jgi:predicted TPR repeat methyltransferase
MTTSSYIHSHTAPGKGIAYDHSYRENHFQRYLWAREQRILDSILATYFPGTPVDLLDFACGTGRIVSVLEHRVRSATGVDVSEAMLEVARKKLKRTKLHNGNLLQDRLFPDRQFNLITAFRFFVNAESELRVSALRALEPLLAPGGFLVFNNHQNLDAPYLRLARAYARWRGFAPCNTLCLAQCRALLAGVGLEIVRLYPAGMLHLPKNRLPHGLYRAADRCADLFEALAKYSESPVIVARRQVAN